VLQFIKDDFAFRLLSSQVISTTTIGNSPSGHSGTSVLLCGLRRAATRTAV
jgi:hypothetical protein